MRQLHIVYSIAKKFGGLGLAAFEYSQSISKGESVVDLYVVNETDDDLKCSEINNNFNIIYGKKDFLSNLFYLNKCINKKHDILHLHGTWSPLLAGAYYIAKTKKIPVVISPHGCLELWALNHKVLKKKIALTLYQLSIFKKSKMLFATSKQELSSIRALGINTPTAVIPIGVNIPANFTKVNNTRNILFLSRIHPIKGLVYLVKAWNKVRKDGWNIVIAGSDENGHIIEIKALINSLGLESDFSFIGLVTADKKEQVFENADVFILPTFSENFGIVIAEALAHGVPVITTTGAPWEDISIFSCGWWVSPEVDAIAGALVEAMSTSESDLYAMGQRGMNLIKNKYSWDKISQMSIDAYVWALNPQGKKPEFIDII